MSIGPDALALLCAIRLRCPCVIGCGKMVAIGRFSFFVIIIIAVKRLQRIGTGGGVALYNYNNY